jgi:methyl-accepting chemotaxis protein
VSPILRLLDTLSMPPRGAGPSSVWLAVLYHLANLTITVCYLAIPGIVLYYWRYRREGISPRALWMVLAFLPVQALSRLVRVDGISFRVVATLDVLAAIVTVNSVYWLRPKILHILRKILDRIDKIVDRHLASEALNRQQIGEMSEANRALFDRVIGICLELSNSIKELTSGARANEKAIIELRAELRSLAGPAQPKALGHDEPRPFGPG